VDRPKQSFVFALFCLWMGLDSRAEGAEEGTKVEEQYLSNLACNDADICFLGVQQNSNNVCAGQPGKERYFYPIPIRHMPNFRSSTFAHGNWDVTYLRE
jgi:hypothetical protein